MKRNKTWQPGDQQLGLHAGLCTCFGSAVHKGAAGGGQERWWKAINNTCVISQRDEEGKSMLHGDFKAGTLDSIQGHFRECGHPVFTGGFLGCIQQTQAALQHACRETISTRNSVLVLPCRELWLHAHSYQNLATETQTIIRLVKHVSPFQKLDNW